MKKIISIVIFACSLSIFGQENKFSEKEIEIKLDSIKNEGNLLFSLENSSWNASDIARKSTELKDLLGTYITYKSENIVKTVFLNKTADKVLAEYSFLNNEKKPSKEIIKERPLNTIETDLKNIRIKLIPQFSDEKYEIQIPDGFSLNLITIPFGTLYKTYLIAGTPQSGVIPFGNDHLFITDSKGNIVEHKKFHSRLIPTYTSGTDGNTLTMSTHSHLKTEPFISATDICTFKLYAPFSKLDKFSVYSPALNTYFEYDYKKDTLKKVKSPL